MRKYVFLLIILILVCFTATCFAARNKGTDDQTRAKIVTLMNNTPEVSWEELRANESAYKDKVVKMSGLRFFHSTTTNNAFVTLLVNAQGQHVFLASTNYYPWQDNVEYAICGQFKLFQNLLRTETERVPMACIFEMAHLPWYNE